MFERLKIDSVPEFLTTSHNRVIDVVVDLSLASGTAAALLLEGLSVAREGVPCKYHLWLPNGRLDSTTQAHFRDLLETRDCKVFPPGEMGDIEFPRELIDPEIQVNASDLARRRSIAKKNWFRGNLAVLHAIEHFDQFVLLSTGSFPSCHDWLSRLVEAGATSSVPVLSEFRELRWEGASYNCGWGMTGWFNGKALRQLPLRNSFSQRLPNPWQPFVAQEERASGPGFCLSGDWLSAFDVPMDYLLFTLYCTEKESSLSPLEWEASSAPSNELIKSLPPSEPTEGSPAAEEGKVVLTRMAGRIWQEGRVRDLYRQKASAPASGRLGNMSGRFLPLGGPTFNVLGGNRVRFSVDDLADSCLGERCFIIGNGPSLKTTDLTRLQSEYTIGLNRIYLNYENMGFQPSFFCITNPNIIEQFSQEIDLLNSIKFLTYRTRHLIKNRWNAFFFETRGQHDFYTDLTKLVWSEGCTVTYCAMQVAYFLGFEEVVLVGVDHGFPNSGTPNKLVVADGPDSNHFHPDYFGEGVKWQYPDLAGSEVSYRVAKGVFEKAGRRISDATIGGNLDIFQKVDYYSYF